MVPTIVSRGAAYLCGISKLGYPVVMFSSSYSTHKKRKMSANDLLTILSYYSKVAKDIHGTTKLVLLADFKSFHHEMILNIVDAAKRFYCESCDIYKMYILDTIENPQKVSLKNFVKSSKKRQTIWADQLNPVPFTVLENMHDLFQYIDHDQLSVEFQGRLSFNLNSWIHVQSMIETLAKVVYPIKNHGLKFVAQLESKSLEKMSENPAVTQKEVLAWYKKKQDSLQIEQVLQQCKNIVSLLLCPYDDPLLSEMEGQPVFKHAKCSSLRILQEVSVINRKVIVAWKKLKKLMKMAVELLEFEGKVEESALKMSNLEKKLEQEVVKPNCPENCDSFVEKSYPDELYQLIVSSTAEGYSLLKDVKQLVWSDAANNFLLGNRVIGSGCTGSSCSVINPEDKRIFSEVCKEKFSNLQEKCFPRPEFVFGDPSSDIDSLYKKCFEFYRYVITSLTCSPEDLNVDALLSELCSLDISHCNLSLPDLVCLHEKIFTIDDAELRHQVRLLVYRSSVLLQACNSKICASKFDMKAFYQWKAHLEARCQLGDLSKLY